jgi:hypothetical protein
MNERILELIEQSGFGSYAEIPDTYIVHKNDLAEFAELIVQECVEFVFKKVGAKSALDLSKHFGVEE